ncbi:MAG: TraR/DksA family transcriptional regulator [Planctomycetes bacterium]|nr:TraR/DksA family transcriptional regulator [Planctomycetota bacterium]
MAKRADLAGDVAHLADGIRGGGAYGGGQTSSMPQHMAELGSDNWEQDFNIGLIASEQARVREIDAALERLENGTYGICLATHKPITIARLLAKPWAEYSIEYARLREEGRVP